VSKSGFQCVSGRSYRHGRVGNQSAKAECGHVAGSVVERHSRHPKIRRFNHGYTSLDALQPGAARHFHFSDQTEFVIRHKGLHSPEIQSIAHGKRVRITTAPAQSYAAN
jgi:hypothetical protein